MEALTKIDTISLQVDFDNPYEQQSRLQGLINFVVETPTLYYNFKDVLNVNSMITYRTYFIYCNGTILATVTTGLFQTVVNGHKVIKYYMLIKFAGLKTYNEIVDKGSYIGLMKVCAFLNGTKQDRRDRYRNNRGLPFKIKELDCCIDVNYTFQHLSHN
jgi:hypothetical protein